jgi:hypothetical protein
MGKWPGYFAVLWAAFILAYAALDWYLWAPRRLAIRHAQRLFARGRDAEAVAHLQQALGRGKRLDDALKYARENADLFA